MSTEFDLQDVRRKAQEIVERAKADPALEDQLKNDPDGTLLGLGFPEREIPDFLQEQGLQPEVAGYIACADFTCFSSNCPASCFVTIRIW
jgi:hypothetical protein